MNNLVTLDMLVAEDKEEELRETKNALNYIAEKFGFLVNIDSADNVNEAIRKAITNNYDVLLLDYDFSKSKTDTSGNGFDIIKKIRGAKPEQVMYLLSGEGDLRLMMKLIKFRAEYFLNVPFIKKIWFERKPRLIFPRKQPKDVDTYGHLERVMVKHYLIKGGIPMRYLHVGGHASIW